MALRVSGSGRAAAVNALLARINAGGSGTLRLYTGAQPPSPDSAATGTLLAELPMSNPAFANADSAAVAIVNAITDDADPLAAGQIGYFRIVSGSGVAEMDGLGGTSGSGAEIEFDSLSVQLGVPVRVTGGSIILPL